MRDLIAGIVALALLVVAASLATTLQYYRRRRQRARDAEGAMGRRIVAELPTSKELVYFSEDEVRFYYGEQSIDKDLIRAAHVLINGSPIAAAVSTRHGSQGQTPTTFEDCPFDTAQGGAFDLAQGGPDGIARDRWDVAIETERGTVLVECGAIRERVSQELARSVFDAVRRSIDAHNQEVGGRR